MSGGRGITHPRVKHSPSWHSAADILQDSHEDTAGGQAVRHHLWGEGEDGARGQWRMRRRRYLLQRFSATNALNAKLSPSRIHVQVTDSTESESESERVSESESERVRVRVRE